MLTQIKFGTSGWRAVMVEEFTFANVTMRAGRNCARCGITCQRKWCAGVALCCEVGRSKGSL
jgi:hypothetical protein